MLLSLNWLEDFIKLPKSVKAEDLASRLTNHTVEVETIIKQNQQFSGVVVGKVLSVDQHPHADRLHLLKVDVKDTVLNIVCGAPNVAVGQMVPVATIGAILPGEVTIKESDIRGEKSFGMVCAEDELGLGRDHEGILVLDKKARAGQDFADYLQLKDTILEIDNKSLSNRSDLFGHYGLAREISTFYQVPLKPYVDFIDQSDLNIGSKVVIKVEDKKLCPRYLAIKVGGIKIQESPRWLKERLIAVGLKPINNLVDLTNYVMLESGQPLHAFSSELVDKIIVRSAKKGEHIETLDGKEYELTEGMLVIADSHQPIAIAGVMGGQQTAIHAGTTEVIIEAANFEAVSIRKTAGKLNIRTDSSLRFEKSLDPTLAEQGLRRMLFLIKKICREAKVMSGLTEVSSYQLNQGPITISLDWINRKAGQKIPEEQVIDILRRLGFEVSLNEPSQITVLIPTWRAAKDVSTAEDILEEILRIFGYNQIKAQPLISALSSPARLLEKDLEKRLQDFLAGAGAFTEVYNYSFLGENLLKKLEVDPINFIRLANPLSNEHTLLRQSLIPGLMSNLKNNQFNYEEIRFFEIGRIFLDTPGIFKKTNDQEDLLPYQGQRIALTMAGKKDEYFSELKGLVEQLLTISLYYNWETEFTTATDFPSFIDRSQAVRIRVNDHDLGFIAVVDKKIANNFGLKVVAAVAEINFEELAALFRTAALPHYREVPKYPPVVRDLAFVVNTEIMYNDIRKEMLKFNVLVASVELFDSYQGGQLGLDKKNLAFHITYQAEDRTLTSEEIDQMQEQLFSLLAAKFGAKLRDF